jgi:hypothetical protein
MLRHLQGAGSETALQLRYQLASHAVVSPWLLFDVIVSHHSGRRRKLKYRS